MAHDTGSSTKSVEDLAFALEEHVKQYEHTRDPVYLQSPAALELADKLFYSIDWFGPVLSTADQARRFTVAAQLGPFYWYRFELANDATRKPGDWDAETRQTYGRAKNLSTFVYGYAPQRVPARLRAVHERENSRRARLQEGTVDFLNSRAVDLLRLAEQTSDVSHLHDATALLVFAIGLTQGPGPERGMLLTHLGNVLTRRFELTQSVDLLQRSLRAHMDAGMQTPSDDPLYSQQQSGLGHALIRQFEFDGDLQSLHSAIQALRAASRATWSDESQRPAALTNLVAALMTWSTFTGDSSAADECIAVQSDALSLTPDGHPDLPSRLTNLGVALADRGYEFVHAAAVHRPIELFRRAAELTPAGHPNHLGTRRLLASALRSRGSASEDTSDLEAAEALLRAAVRDSDPHQHTQSSALHELALTLCARFERTKEAIVLDEAVSVMQQSLTATAPENTHRAWLLKTLGDLMHRRFLLGGQKRDRQFALDAFEAAQRVESAPPSARALAARYAGQLHAESGDFHAALGALAHAIEQMDLAVWHGLQRKDQEEALKSSVTLACDAAACAIEIGRPEYAVELLEQGRSVLLTRALEPESNFEQLHEFAPELAGRFAAVQNALDSFPADLPGADPIGDAIAQRSERDRRVALARERDALIDQIRSTPDLADFLRPPRFASLMAAAERGPVVLVNVSSLRRDALILTREGLRVVPLPNLTIQDIADNTIGFFRTLEAMQTDAPRAMREFEKTMAWLWDAIAEPVLNALGISALCESGRDAPHIWWCPTSLLSLMPLHAAGRHDTRDGVQPATVLDRVVSSYTPNLRSLIQARARTAPAPMQPLIVSMPTTPGWPEIPAAASEAQQLLARFPQAEHLSGDAATRHSVLAAIRRSSWAHFACHGAQDVSEPWRGAVILHDGPLTLREIVGRQLGRGELAFLSACDTSRGGLQLPDEAMSFAMTLHVACYRHVIGSLWPTVDDDAPGFARDVYDGLERNGSMDTRSTALALHTAMRAFRDRMPHAPLRWASYIHIGP